MPRKLIGRLADLAASVPAVARLARWAARRRAGRHHVAAVAVVVRGGEVLVAEHRFRVRRSALIAGWVNTGEDPARAAEREVGEETGLIVEALDLVAHERHGTGTAPTPYAAISLAFACRLIDDEHDAAAPLSAELTSVRWMDRTEAKRYLSAFEFSAFERALQVIDRGEVNRR